MLRIRPSVEYDVERVVAKSRFAAATALGLGPPAPQCLDDTGAPIAFSCHSVRAKDRHRNHRIGPGLELEVVLPGKAALRTSMYAGARVLFLLDNESYTLRDSSGLAIFVVERDEAITHIGGGVRLSWFGFSD